MKLHAVSLYVGQRLMCSQCHKFSSPIWADMSGPAFKSYYCEECAKPHTLIDSAPRIGSGGQINITSPSRDEAMAEAERIKAGMDYMSSPSVSCITLSDGRHQAGVRYFTLD